MSTKTLHKKQYATVVTNPRLSYTRHALVQDVENGIVKTSQKAEEYHFNDELKNQDFRVFSISNLMALGAHKNLKRGSIAPDNMSVSDSLDRNINFLANEMVAKSQTQD